jgi:hypothetical protein
MLRDAPSTTAGRSRRAVRSGFPPYDAATYLQILRNGRYVWWRCALGVVVALPLLLILTALISQLVV